MYHGHSIVKILSCRLISGHNHKIIHRLKTPETVSTKERTRAEVSRVRVITYLNLEDMSMTGDR